MAGPVVVALGTSAQDSVWTVPGSGPLKPQRATALPLDGRGRETGFGFGFNADVFRATGCPRTNGARLEHCTTEHRLAQCQCSVEACVNSITCDQPRHGFFLWQSASRSWRPPLPAHSQYKWRIAMHRPREHLEVLLLAQCTPSSLCTTGLPSGGQVWVSQTRARWKIYRKRSKVRRAAPRVAAPSHLFSQ